MSNFMDLPPEELLKHFRGTHNRAEVHFLVFQGTITSTELCLIAVVDAFAKARGEGCWASNEYLAKWCNVTVRQVQYMVQHLKELGLVSQVGWKKVRNYKLRVLETKWTQVGEGAEKNWSPMKYTSPNLSSSSLRSESESEGGATAGGVRHPAPLEVSSTTSQPSSEKTREQSMPFFNDVEEAKTLQPLQIDKDRADQLRQAVAKANRRVSKDKTKWAHQFRILRDQVGTERVGATLSWYLEHQGDKGVPVIDDGKQFKERFNWLEDLTKSSARRNPTVVVTDEAAGVARRLGRLPWPKGVKDQIPTFAQVSLDNLKAFRARLAKVSDPKLKPLAKEVLARIGLNAAFVERWLEAVYERVKGWDKWSGDLSTTAFTGAPDCKELQKQGRQWAAAYCGRQDRWDQLMEATHRG